MDKIILANKTEYEIADGASIGNIQVQAKDFNAIKMITDAFSADNLAEVTFAHGDQVSGKYTDLKVSSFSYIPNIDTDETYTVTIQLAEKNEIEKRLDALEIGHEANAGAIEELADMVAGGEA